MKSDTKSANSKIANIYSLDFFIIFPAKDPFIENISTEPFAQLIICIHSKRVLFLFIFIWVALC